MTKFTSKFKERKDQHLKKGRVLYVRLFMFVETKTWRGILVDLLVSLLV